MLVALVPSFKNTPELARIAFLDSHPQGQLEIRRAHDEPRFFPPFPALVESRRKLIDL